MSQITATAEAAIRGRIGAVSGLQIDEIRTRPDAKRPAKAGFRMVEVDVSLTGWSCTLHRLKMRWRETVELREGACGIEQARASKDLFALRIAKQMGRLQQGIAMGLAVPLFSWMPTEEIDVTHLVIDRALAEMMTERNPAALIQMLQESIMNLHQEPDDGLRDELLGDQTAKGRTWTMLHRMTDDSFYYGDQLWTRGTLPQTVLVAVVGRRLGDVVDGAPATVADRTITAAELSDDGDGTEFSFEPDNATVRRILDEWSGAVAAP